jgi:hypothetical protein
MKSEELIKYFLKNPNPSPKWQFSHEHHYVQFQGETHSITFDDGCNNSIVIQVYENKNEYMNVIDGYFVKDYDIKYPNDFIDIIKPLFQKYSPKEKDISECICSSYDLFQFGCTCGFIQNKRGS